jgi:phosphoenolpyruvate synthase/pyruvate phosphate dikinase
MTKKFYPKDYQTLFRLDVVKGMVTGLLSDFIIHGSLGLGNPIITFDGKWWTFRLYKKSEMILAKKGLRIFRNKTLYAKYAKEFKQYIRFADKNIVSKYKNISSKISKKDFFELTNKLQEFWHYYGITEFVYHDLAHKVMIETENMILKKNLADLEKLKFKGRALLNSFILENGTIDNILKCVSQKYSINKDIIKYFFLQDLRNLFINKKINLNIIKQRKKSFVVAHIDKKVYYLEDEKARKISQSFAKFEQAEFKKAAKGLKGHIANKGMARGKVVISPMLDIKAAMEVEKRMKKGDILVVQSTNPDLMALCNKAGAIVTDQGGMLSHAAIISRELGIPCIVGTTNGTKVFKDGDFVEVDATKGIIRILKKVNTIDK